LQFIPISIDYEKIVESKSYVHELSGGEKKKEDVASLVKSREALKSKYGKIYVQVADPVSLKEFMSDRGYSDRDLSDPDRRSLVQTMAHRILFEINQVSTVTPSALLAFSLLTHRRRGMTQEDLIERAKWVADWIRRRGHTRFSSTLDDFRRSLAEAASRFSRDGLIAIQDTGHELVYSPVEQKRLALDYYRNNIIHHFVPAAICALALESFSVGAPPLDALRDRIRELSTLFKFEFLFRSERHFENEVRLALDELKAEGIIKEENGFVVKVAERQDQRSLFRAVLEHFVEAYWLTARNLSILHKNPMNEKDFISRTLQTGDRLFVQGEIMFHESLNREVIKNAVKVFVERDLVESTAQEGRKGPRLSVPEDRGKDLESLANDLLRYLPARN
jgi:glycerol-3-phosphate O-acyltransferase